MRARLQDGSQDSSAEGLLEGEGGTPKGLRVFSRDAMEQVWLRKHLLLGGGGGGGGGGLADDLRAQEVTGLALDLALLAIMSGGNDYLPPMPVRYPAPPGPLSSPAGLEGEEASFAGRALLTSAV